MMLAELMRAGNEGVGRKRRKDQTASTTPAVTAGVVGMGSFNPNRELLSFTLGEGNLVGPTSNAQTQNRYRLYLEDQTRACL